MKLFRDVIWQVMAKGQGCSLISCNSFEYKGVVPLAGGGEAPEQNITQDMAPWRGQQPYLSAGFARAQSDILDRPQTFFPGQTYAAFSPQTEQALNLTEQRALAGSPVQRAANQQLQNTLAGDYLYGGRGFNAALDAARNRILPNIQSRFSLGGRFGSGLGREAEARALSDAFANQYQNERQNQLRAMLFAPQAAASDYADVQALGGVGARREAMNQQAINEALARHQFAQEEPTQRLRDYMNLIQGNYGGQSTGQTTGFAGNRGGSILGGALGGASLAGQLFGGGGAGALANPAAGMLSAPAAPVMWPLALGGILGGLSGLF